MYTVRAREEPGGTSVAPQATNICDVFLKLSFTEFGREQWVFVTITAVVAYPLCAFYPSSSERKNFLGGWNHEEELRIYVHIARAEGVYC